MERTFYPPYLKFRWPVREPATYNSREPIYEGRTPGNMARKQNSDHELVASGAGSAPARRRLSKHSRTSVRANQALPAESVSETASNEPAVQPAREQIALLAYSYWEDCWSISAMLTSRKTSMAVQSTA
jgi:hypothetical protein